MPTLVEIVPYDPEWANDFVKAEALLRSVLGECVVEVEHIGSTAVPGLAAKPILDIDVIVSCRQDIPAASAGLIGAGFEPRGNRHDPEVWAFLLKHPDPQIRAYLCLTNNPTHRKRIIFRDYLRQHDDVALAYSRLKRNLAEQFPYDGEHYTAEKVLSSPRRSTKHGRTFDDLSTTRMDEKR